MISTSELAKLAGVSQSTISRCLNDHPSISYETKERVQKLALQYGYVEQKRGRKTLFSGEHKVIGILVEDRPFFDDLFINYTIGKLISKASKKNYYTIRLPISSREEGSMERLREFLRLNLIDGFIIMHRHFDEEIHEYLCEIGIPHVYLLHCSRNSFEAVDMIDTDNYAGGYLGTRHLIEKGHQNIITLTCPWREFEDRTKGYLHALEEAHITPNPDFVLMGECSYQSAYDITCKNLDLFKNASAIYVQSDIMTTGVISALQHHGILIPEDISVIGSDGYDLGIVSNPQFDSVAHPISELADLAISRLIENIGKTHRQSPRQIILRPYIVERSSVRDMNKACDLHTHSIFSDGTYTPEELIDEAINIGLSAIALCDHNTIDGLPDFIKAAKGKNIEAICGAEFSVDYKGTELHLLGLFLEENHFDTITDMMNVYIARKEQSNIDLVAALARDGYILDYDKMKEKSPTGKINRAHIAAALTEAGYTESIKQAFQKLLAPGIGYYKEPKRITVWEMLKFLQSIHAIPVLAHPFLNLSESELLNFLPKAKEFGLVGMETAYSTYDEATTALAATLAQKFGLLPSGGSDFHGANKPHIKLGTGMGNLHIPSSWSENLKSI